MPAVSIATSADKKEKKKKNVPTQEKLFLAKKKVRGEWGQLGDFACALEFLCLLFIDTLIKHLVSGQKCEFFFFFLLASSVLPTEFVAL